MFLKDVLYDSQPKYICMYIHNRQKGGENIQVNMLKFKQREPVRSYENLILCKYVLFVSK